MKLKLRKQYIYVLIVTLIACIAAVMCLNFSSAARADEGSGDNSYNIEQITAINSDGETGETYSTVADAVGGGIVVIVSTGTDGYYNGYTALQDAFDAATDGATIILIDDNIELSDYVTINWDSDVWSAKSDCITLTLDLNGKTITLASEFDSLLPTNSEGVAIRVYNANLTIIDSAGNGGIDGSSVTNAGNSTGEINLLSVQADGTLIIEAGTYTISNASGACVYAFKDGSIIINGGTFINSYDGNYPYSDGGEPLVVNQANVSDQLVTINGGTFIGRNPAFGDDSSSGASTFISEDVTLYEGRDDSDNTAYYVGNDESVVPTDVTIVASYSVNDDGSVVTANYAYSADEIASQLEAGAEYIIIGADIELTSALNISNSVTIDLNGNSIYKESGDSYVVIINSGLDVAIINGAESESKITNGTSVVYSKGSNLTIENVTIESGFHGIVFLGMYAPAECPTDDTSGYYTLNLNNVKVTAYAIAVSGNGGEEHSGTIINISDSTITGELGIGIYHPQYGILNILGDGNVISGSSGIEIRAGILNVYGGTITGTWSEFTTYPDSASTGTSVDGVAVVISQHSTHLPIEVNIYGGTLSATAADGYALYEDYIIPAEYTPTNITISITGGTFKSAIFSDNVTTSFIYGGTFSEDVAKEYIAAVAYIDNTYYATLQDAIDAAGETVTKIILFSDVQVTDYIIIDTDQEITLDLNGKTISSGSGTSSLIAALANTIGSDYLIVNYGTLGITDNSTESNGLIEGNNIIYSSGILTVDNVTITTENNGTALYVAAGFATIAGGTVESLTVEEGGSATISGGTVESLTVEEGGSATVGGGTVESLSVDEGADVTITGGSFGEDITEIVEEYLAPGYILSYDRITGTYYAYLECATEIANAQADVRTYMSANGWNWSYILELAANEESKLYSAASAVVAAYEAISEVITSEGVVSSRLEAMDAVDELVNAFNGLKEGAIKKIEETIKEIEEETSDVVTVPTATYAAIYSATTESDVEYLLEAALREIDAIHTYLNEISEQTTKLEKLAEALNELSDDLFNDESGAIASAVESILSEINYALAAIVGTDGSADSVSLAEIYEYLSESIYELLDEIEDDTNLAEAIANMSVAINSVLSKLSDMEETVGGIVAAAAESAENDAELQTSVNDVQSDIAGVVVMLAVVVVLLLAILVVSSVRRKSSRL